MTTIEKLTKIRAWCINALEIASRRTPGKWTDDRHEHDQPNLDIEIRSGIRGICKVWIDDAPVEDYNREQRANAAFITLCAGAIEASLRTTIATIDSLLKEEFGRELTEWHPVDQLAAATIKAWEGIV